MSGIKRFLTIVSILDKLASINKNDEEQEE